MVSPVCATVSSKIITRWSKLVQIEQLTEKKIVVVSTMVYPSVAVAKQQMARAVDDAHIEGKSK